jgi:hypothetical protein
MSAAKHTPGPWVQDTLGGTAVFGGGELVADCAPTAFVGKYAIANARLIAAAPTMLEALRNIEAWAASPGECTLDVMRACIRRTLEGIES